jgi:hypothetical protein
MSKQTDSRVANSDTYSILRVMGSLSSSCPLLYSNVGFDYDFGFWILIAVGVLGESLV